MTKPVFEVVGPAEPSDREIQAMARFLLSIVEREAAERQPVSLPSVDLAAPAVELSTAC